ncbi:Bacterial regulatory protein, tetR family [Rhodococcus erythropolis]|uniref:TetR/AcrR family transcriptional regulator n=1 Tax=Rhodococcus erythropolis TaxID=1833 RepID=UPI000BB34575|nr:TetR/AcrR family transcriptional regulator [Rhodococcus erythropolis]PBI88816.1 Bacterial regulatory protein, tetR family [Rhodococcus erythropolis]
MSRSSDTTRPTGPDEVRAAILEAAATHLSREGSGASLRDIAADADVNLGLIYRYVGRKDDLIRAVLNDRAEVTSVVDSAVDTSEAVQRIFETGARNTTYIRIVAWLLLEDSRPDLLPATFPTLDAIRSNVARDSPQELGLIAAMVMLYGWTIFGDRILESFGRSTTEGDVVYRSITGLAARMVSTPEDFAP